MLQDFTKDIFVFWKKYTSEYLLVHWCSLSREWQQEHILFVNTNEKNKKTKKWWFSEHTLGPLVPVAMCKCHSLPVYSSSPWPSLYNNIVLSSERDFQLNNTELIMINWNPKSPALSPERLGGNGLFMYVQLTDQQ